MKKLLSYAEQLNSNFWVRASNVIRIPPESFPVLRIAVGLFLLLFFFNNFTWLSELPDLLFAPHPLSIGFFLDKVPGRSFFLFLSIGLLICNVCIILGIRARYAGFLYVLLSIIGFSFLFSFNKIDHNTNVGLAALFLLSFTNWGTDLAIVPDKKIEYRDPNKYLALLALLLCLAFFSAGFMKMMSWSNFDFSKNGTGRWFYPRYFKSSQSFLLSDLFYNYFPFWFFKVMDYVAVVFELAPLLILYFSSKKNWQRWLIVACAFHLTNILFLNIPGFISMAVAYMAFFDLSRFAPGIRKVFSQKPLRTLLLAVLSTVVTGRIYQVLNNIPARNILSPDYYREMYLYVEGGVWASVIIGLLYLRTRSQKTPRIFVVRLKKLRKAPVLDTSSESR